jgi:hypothetical protein
MEGAILLYNNRETTWLSQGLFHPFLLSRRAIADWSPKAKPGFIEILALNMPLRRGEF